MNDPMLTKKLHAKIDIYCLEDSLDIRIYTKYVAHYWFVIKNFKLAKKKKKFGTKLVLAEAGLLILESFLNDSH